MSGERVENAPAKIQATIETEDFVIGNEYPVKIKVLGMEKGHTISFEFKAFGSIRLSDEEKWYSSLSSDGEEPSLTFNIRAVEVGIGSLEIDSYYKTRWLSRIKFENIEVKLQSK
ncbi:MAG TPA: hypothetical protein VJ227_02215 [Patescibacteria group bacterium]|nr:hypothetical protein [Patescibacteria group bacterium]